MRTIRAKSKELNVADYKMRRALDTDVKEIVSEPTTIVDERGDIKVIYDVLPFDTAPYLEAIQRIKYQETERTAGLKTVSRIFGFSPRVTLRKDFCSATSLVKESPEEHEMIIKLGQEVSKLYLAQAPRKYQEHSDTTQKVREEYQIPGTPFTSGIINKNNPLKYHFDTGNFKQVFSCMVAFKKNCEGGHLALPEYDMALEIADNSVLLFDGQEILHGVTPFEIKDEGYRYTVVFYSLRRMWECLTVTDEIARIRKLKTEREKKRVNNNGK